MTMSMTMGLEGVTAAGETAAAAGLEVELARRLCWHCLGSYAVARIESREHDMQVDVIRDGPFLVVAFRGTEPTVGDWRRNLRCRLVPFDRRRPELGAVHAGYHAGVSAVWDELADHLSLAELSGWQVALTGHSAGGAMAIDAAARLDRRARPLTMTFGAPAVGDRQFARAYPHHQHTHRIEHDADLVPWLLAGRYRSVGRVWFLPGDGRIVAQPGRWYRLGRLLGKAGRRLEHLADHRIEAYRSALQQVAEANR